MIFFSKVLDHFKSLGFSQQGFKLTSKRNFRPLQVFIVGLHIRAVCLHLQTKTCEGNAERNFFS